jgi:hypothetical protein
VIGVGLAFDAFVQKCEVCRIDATARREWGCDGDSVRPVGLIRCWACYGSGCGECDRGRRPIYRCPRASVSRFAVDALRLLALYEQGAFPAAGGLMDQAAAYVEAMQCLTVEVSRARDEESKRWQTPTKK